MAAKAQARERVREESGLPRSGALDNALVLTAVSAILKHVLENGLVQSGVSAGLGSDVVISALPPDRVATGENEGAQINLYLYEVRPKGLDSPARCRTEKDDPMTAEAALAFELFYLLTAYGARDFQIETLLGYATEVLRANTSLSADALQRALHSLSAAPGSREALPALAGLAESALARRLAQLRIYPFLQSPDELSRLWSGLQARYRTSAAYKVAVFLQTAASLPEAS